MPKNSTPLPGRPAIAVPAVLAATILSALGTATAPTSAHAFFGDVCLDEVVARGAWRGSHSSAITSARRAWEPAAAKRYSRRFADFEYSGERQFTCSWNDAGTRYRCTVSARACGPKKPR